MSIELQRMLLSLEIAAEKQQMAAEDDYFQDEMGPEDEMFLDEKSEDEKFVEWFDLNQKVLHEAWKKIWTSHNMLYREWCRQQWDKQYEEHPSCGCDACVMDRLSEASQ
jgi:hypothetical protein